MLSPDILFLICEQLRLIKDFDTLFQCSLVSRVFAAAALPNLWRIHELATNEEKSDIEIWLTLWRSLILSSFPGSTYAPYVHYIRVLSLRDFEDLLDEKYFKTTARRTFFTGKLEEFSRFYSVASARRSRYEPDWSSSIRQTSIAVGDHITKYCDEILRLNGRKSVLEELDCKHISMQALQDIVPRITGLRTLRLWDGCALKSVAPLIRKHCPKFEALTIYLWESDNVDEDFAEFLNDLQPQTLRHLEIISSVNSESLTTAALSKHSESLLSLKIGSRNIEFGRCLPLIGTCSRLNLLHFDVGNVRTIMSKKEFKQVSNWLSTCTSLADLKLCLALGEFGPEILVPTLQSGITLTQLHLQYYNGASAKEFHRALVAQADSLEDLTLSGEAEDMDCEILVTSLARLTKLQSLHLLHISNYFKDMHIISLATRLTLLQELVVGGWMITDSIWQELSNLCGLRRLDLNTFSAFSARGILYYIECLTEGNTGLVLSIAGQDPYHPLQQAEQDRIQDALAAKVDGRFEFILGRDPNAPSDSESDSD